jgi:hypothetical protein
MGCTGIYHNVTYFSLFSRLQGLQTEHTVSFHTGFCIQTDSYNLESDKRIFQLL